MSQVLLAEFADPEACAAAVRALRGQGREGLDVYMPFRVKSVEDALSPPQAPLSWLALGAGVLGAGVAYFVLWWTQHVDYPLNVGSHPTHSAPAYVGIVFETAVLFAAVVVFFGLLMVCGLPRLHHPVFEVPIFERASLDRFLVSLPCEESERAASTRVLECLGALSVTEVRT